MKAGAAEAGEMVEYDTSGKLSVAEDAQQAKDAIIVRMAEAVDAAASNGPYATGNSEMDAITLGMWPGLQGAARLLMKKLVSSAPVIVRFHNDADGSAGAFSLYLSAKDLCSRLSLRSNIIWLMQKGVSYSAIDAENDILIANNYSCIERPLLFIIDFGTSVDSNAGLERLGGAFDIVWLDHHPLQQGFAGASLEHYVNPWRYGGDSNYTAGLLASVFSKTFSRIDTGEFEGASLIGDYSKYAGGRGAEISALLDFVTSDLKAVYGPSKSNITPQEIESILSNPARTKELLDYANIKLDEAIDNGIKSVKRYRIGSSNLCVLDFEDVRLEDSKYPLPGRFASKLLVKLNGAGIGRVMLLVNVGAYLLMRVDKDLCADLDVLSIIEEMKARYPVNVEGGGGHRCAGSIKLADKSASKEMSAALLGIIRSEMAKHDTGTGGGPAV